MPYHSSVISIYVHVHTCIHVHIYCCLYSVFYLVLQCQEAIVEGTHPVTKQEAIQLASLQVQAQFGNQVDGRVDRNFIKSL